MSNSDYLIKATIKKLSEKLNKTLSSKIDEAATAAQEVPELLKKEIEILTDDIIKEAKRMEQEIENEPFDKENPSEDSIFKKTSNKISSINQTLNQINSILDN
tara:strand:- start:488 stop:796 length:309 start_codon:yes stop_codon:yes gene_type:complete